MYASTLSEDAVEVIFIKRNRSSNNVKAHTVINAKNQTITIMKSNYASTVKSKKKLNC